MAIALHFDEDQVYVMYQWHGGQGSRMYAAASSGYLGTGHERFRDKRTDDEWLRDLVVDLEYEVTMAIGLIDQKEGPDAIDLADRDTLQTILVMCQDYLAD